MQAPLDSVRSADWFVYHDWCREMADRGESPPRPPFVVRQIAEVLRWYEEREEEPLLYCAPGSGPFRWDVQPPTATTRWSSEQGWTQWAWQPNLDDEDAPMAEYMTNPQERPWLKKNWPGACWDFFGILVFLAISGRRA